MSALSDLEFRVYMHYITAANDLGVYPAIAAKFQGDNVALRNRPGRKVQAAIDQIVELGLLQVFTAEGHLYLWCLKWQDWQGIRWPRRSHYPVPPDRPDTSQATARLFKDYGEKHGALAQDFGETAEELPQNSDRISASRARAHGAQARNPNPNPKTHSHPDPDPDARVNDEPPPRWVVPASGQQPVSLLSGAVHRSHQGHAYCPPGRANLCVTAYIHEHTRDALGGDVGTRDSRARALYEAAIEALGDRPCTDDALVFWRNVRQRAVAPISSPPTTPITGKGEASRQSMQRVVSRIAGGPS